jgi:hypothetical protein
VKRHRVPGVVAFLVVACLASGCGGDGEPSAEERRAAMARWVDAADEACRKAEAAIVARGEPVDLRDVDRVVVRAAADLRRAAATIRRLPMPPGGDAKVKPVLDAIEALEPRLQDVTEWSEVAKADELVKAANAWRSEAEELERRAGRAGLRACGRPWQRHAMAEAIITPVFRTQLAEFEHVLLAELRTIRRRTAVTDGASLAAFLNDFSELIAEATARYYALDPPVRAEAESDAYVDVLETADIVAAQWAREARTRRVDAAFTRSLARRFNRLGRDARRAGRALALALQTAPAEDDPVEPDEPTTQS